MALRVLQFAATIPAGTPKTAPVTTTFALDNWEVEAIGLEVPPGPGGLMGFYVANNGVPWIPQPAGSYLVWDNYRDKWPLEGQPNASGWQVVGYNTGVYAHTVTVRFHVKSTVPGEAPAPMPAIVFETTATREAEPVTL